MSTVIESDEPPTPAAPEHESTTVMRCARCNHPIAAAADLLPEQIPRLESASYPYQLDLLGNEEAWVYSATNANQHRFDVCRFGPSACARLEISGDGPTDEHSFFPPFAWRMAACARCSAHLGWAFGAAEGGEPQFAGLILTHMRETQCTIQELNTPPPPWPRFDPNNDAPAALAALGHNMPEAQQLRQLLIASGHDTSEAQAYISQLIALLEPHSPAGRQQILDQLRSVAEIEAEAEAEADGDAGNAASVELSAEEALEAERTRAAEVIQAAASHAMLAYAAEEARQSEQAGGGGEEPDGGDEEPGSAPA